MARRLAFAFTIAEGPNAGLTTGGWRLRVKKDDVYLIPAELGHMWKLSLHGDRAWRWAVTSEHVRSGNTPVWPGPGRAPWTWEPPPFVDGARLCFVICTFRHALLPHSIDESAVHIAVDDRWDQATLGRIWMTESGVDLNAERLVGGPYELLSGRRVWVDATVEPLTDGEPEPPAVGSMLEFAMPDKDGVSAPGVFHRGVHID